MRKIIHVDMDCFFAAVEMRDNPALRDIPIAIGGSRERRGVISTPDFHDINCYDSIWIDKAGIFF